jgi:hypothetical protein
VEQLPALTPRAAEPEPGLRVEETPPAYVARSAVQAATGDRADALAALVDGRVKRQTSTAAFAILAAVGLAVLIYFGA